MVYIDDFNAPFGRMKMCHMIADTSEELLRMADSIGVARKWLQDKGTHREHFDICLSKKKVAIEGAKVECQGRMCSSCAFKFDSPANLEPHNVEAAHESLAYYIPFNCHTEPGVDKGCPSIGYLHAKRYFDSLEEE